MARQTFVIAIAGASGSGKSSLARHVCEELDDWFNVAVLNEDAYYRKQESLSLEQRERTNYDHPDAIEESLLVEQLASIKSGQSVEVPVYDYSIHDRSDQTVCVGPCDILVVEGILLLHRERVRKVVDLSAFIDVPEELCLQRRIRRDVAQRGRTRESVIAQYQETVGPMFHQFVAPSKKHADIVVENEAHNQEAVRIVLEEVSKRMKLE